jgi:bacillithiol biosynthesis cysteine-adding enzyme BshC
MTTFVLQGVAKWGTFPIAEDHDWDEVKRCSVLDQDAALRTVGLDDPPGANVSPVARVQLDASVADAIAGLRDTLPATEFTEQLLEDLRQAYAPGTGMAEAFGRWLEGVLGPRGLVVYDASDPDAKPLVSGLFAHEIEHAGETSQLAAAAGAALEERGYHAQVTPQDDNVALFHLTDRREPIKRQGDAFLVGERTETEAALLEQVRSAPERFSPNVMLRPLVQDTLFPTVCYVAGPSELAYLGQLRRVYASFGIPMPLVYQRATATILDSNAMRFLTRYDLPFEALRAQDESALNALLEAQLPPSVEASLQDAMRAVEERMGAVAREVPQIDATLEGAARSTLGRMQDDLKKLQGKIIQAAKRRDETLRRQYHHARAQAFPGGHSQERQVGMIHFLNKFGLALVERLAEDLPLEMGTHSVLTV